MRILIILLGLILIPICSSAEQLLEINGKISGTVIENGSQQPIGYATITLYKAEDSTLLNGTISQKNGKFELSKIPYGDYTLEISFIGYEKTKRNIQISKDKKNVIVGNVYLDTESQYLDEVEVVKEISTIEQKIDRKVINVGKDLISAGANALIVLTHVPSINVDQDENISMRGNENVKILIDGKPTHIDASQLLKQIPSTSIKTIELITNPSAKYNPEGMSGIINIILKKNTQLGLNGSISMGYTRNEKNRYNSSLNINYRKGKINLFANLGLNVGERFFYGNVIREDIQLFRDLNFNNESNSNLLKIGFDIFMDKKNTFSFYTNQSFRKSERNGQVIEDYRLPENDSLDITQNFSGDFDNYSQTYNANFKHEFDGRKHFIEAEANINKTKRDDDSRYEYTGERDLADYKDIVDREHINYIFNLDYTNQLSENTKIETGLESRKLTTKNSYITTSQFFSNTDYTYETNIQSFYTSLNHKIGKVSAQVGARLEVYDVEAIQDNSSIYSDDYITVYPSAFLTYVPSEKNQFQLSYSKRVDRPGLRQVNPIRQWSTPSISSFGNPELKPQFTNSFEINYTRQLKNGSITSGIFYRRINDEITRTIALDPNDEYRSILSYDNLGKNDAFGLELSGRYNLIKWWSLNGSIDYYSRTLKGVVENENITVDENISNVRLSNDFKVTKNLRFQLFGMYRGAHQNLQFQVDPIWKVDVGARYNLWKGKGSLSARFSDIFDSFHFGVEANNPYPFRGEFYWGAQSFYVGFTYNFGKKSKQRRRKFRNNQEQPDGGGGGFF